MSNPGTLVTLLGEQNQTRLVMKSSGLIRLSLEGDRCKIDVHLLAGLLAGQALAEPVVHNQVSSLKVRPGKRVGCC